MLTVIVNPVAGSGLAKTIGEKVDALLNERGVEHRTLTTEYAGHATLLSKAEAERGTETVLSVGGDGTLSEVAAGLVGTQTALGIIPAGTGNDFLKVVGVPKTWEAALETALNGSVRKVDTGLQNGSFFLNVCGAGFDVMVLDFAAKAKKHVRGLLPYLYGVIRAISAFRPIDMRITIGDDVVREGKFMLCTVANGRYIGGGIPIMPASEIDDGLLDVLVVTPLPPWKIPFYLPAILGGTLMNKKISTHYRTARCTLESPNMRMNLDGEIIPAESVTFECRPASLLVRL